MSSTFNYIVLCFYVYLYCSRRSFCQSNSNRKVIHVVHLMTEYPKTYYRQIYHQYSVDFAVKLINDNDLIPGHEFKIYHHIENIIDSLSYGLTGNLMSSVRTGPIKMALLGPWNRAPIIGRISAYYNIVQVCYTILNPKLSDKATYPYSARVTENSALVNKLMLKIFQEFKWSKVVIVSNDLPWSKFSRDDMHELLNANNVTILESVLETKRHSGINRLKASNAKIFISFTSYFPSFKYQSNLLCSIYNLKLHSKNRQWFYWLDYIFMSELKSDITGQCTDEQRMKGAEGIITFQPRKPTVEESSTIAGDSGWTNDELKQQFNDYVTATFNASLAQDVISKGLYAKAFDGMWALYRGFNFSLDDFTNIGESVDTFDYSKANMAKILYNNTIETSFYGMTGETSFDENGDKLVDFNIMQIRNSSLIQIGFYTYRNDSITWLVDHETIFPGLGGRPPFDQDIIQNKQVYVDVVLRWISFVVAILLIPIGVVSIIIIHMHRHTEYISNSVPHANYLLLLGCLFICFDVMIKSFDQPNIISCNASTWLIVIGLTFSLGSMFAKERQLYLMYTLRNKKKGVIQKNVTYKQLLPVICLLLALDFVILIPWVVLDPLDKTAYLLDQEEDFDEDSVIIQPIYYECRSNSNATWRVLAHIAKGSYALIGVLYSFETRSVYIKSMNDMKRVGVCFNLVVLLSVGSRLLLFVNPRHAYNSGYIFRQYGSLLGVSFVLALLFVNKVWALYNTLPERAQRELEQRIKTELYKHVTMSNSSLASSVISWDYLQAKHKKISSTNKEPATNEVAIGYIDGLRFDIMNMDYGMMAAIHVYSKPPKSVRVTMEACMLVLGYEWHYIDSWDKLKKYCTNTQLIKLMREFQREDVDYETAIEARDLLSDVSADDVLAACPGAAQFHGWCSLLIELYFLMKADTTHSQEQH